MTGAVHVRALDVMAAADWSFRDNHPVWRHRRHGATGVFDPFPAYPHDPVVVQQAVDKVTTVCPPRYDVDLFIADREDIGRSNGFSNAHYDGGRYEEDHWVAGDPVGLIVLSGKRIPPHHVVTRYLVAHEYGHQVEWMLNHARGAKSLQDYELVRDYAAYRGLPDEAVHFGSGGRWHDSATEVFACDFRIIVCRSEVDYWPHPGVPHPYDTSLPHDLYAWWAAALDDLNKP